VMSSLNRGMLHTAGTQKVPVKGLTEDRAQDDGADIIFDLNDYDFHSIDGEDLQRFKAKRDSQNIFVRKPLVHPDAAGIAVKKRHLYGGKGAERVAFEMTEVNANGVPVGQPFVGKMSLYEEPSQIDFHEISASTQFAAARLQCKFNETLDFRNLGPSVPRITFLEVWYYTWNSETKGSICALLCEKRLDTNRYIKWNDNKGGIHTLNRQPAALVANIEVSNSDSDSDSDDEGEAAKVSDENPSEELLSRIIDEDVPQAFSHWSAVYTKCDLLVCDLQGVFSSNSGFSFTDPAIHSRGRRFGKTDQGKDGMQKFFDSHKCNFLCKALGIEGKVFRYICRRKCVANQRVMKAEY